MFFFERHNKILALIQAFNLSFLPLLWMKYTANLLSLDEGYGIVVLAGVVSLSIIIVVLFNGPKKGLCASQHKWISELNRTCRPSLHMGMLFKESKLPIRARVTNDGNVGRY